MGWGSLAMGQSVVFLVRRREGARGQWAALACYQTVGSALEACRRAALALAGGDEGLVEPTESLSVFGDGHEWLVVARGAAADGSDVFLGCVPVPFHGEGLARGERERVMGW